MKQKMNTRNPFRNCRPTGPSVAVALRIARATPASPLMHTLSKSMFALDLSRGCRALVEHRSSHIRPKIEEEHKDNRHDPAIDHARAQAVDDAANLQQGAIRKHA